MHGESHKDRKEEESQALAEALSHGYGPKIARFALACLGGIPVIGGAFAGAGGAWSEAEQAHFNKVFAAWLKLQEDEVREIGVTIAEILSRFAISDTLLNEQTVQCPLCPQTFRFGYSDGEWHRLKDWLALAERAIREDHKRKHEVASPALEWKGSQRR